MKKFSFLNATRYTLHASGGFALLELLIAVVVFGIITTMVLLAYGKVSEQLFMSTLAYEVGLSFRQAQSFGVSVKQLPGGAQNKFDAAYGIHFAKTNNNWYVLFADSKSNGNKLKYDGEDNASGCTSATECVSVFKIAKGNKISKFCGVRSFDGGEDCSIGAEGITFLDVMFLRPNPDAIIRTNNTDSIYKAARIYLSSPSGMERKVEVWNTGQISIK